MTQRRVQHLRLLAPSPLAWHARARSKLGHRGLLIKFSNVCSDEASHLFDPLLQGSFDLMHALSQLLSEIEEQLLLILQSPLHLFQGPLECTGA